MVRRAWSPDIRLVEGRAFARGHLDDIIANLREADANEALALGFDDPKEACFCMLGLSSAAVTVLVRGRPVFMCGVAVDDDGVAYLWGFGVEGFPYGRAKDFLAVGREIIGSFKYRFGPLRVLVWSRNALHLRALKHLGFEEVHRIGEFVVLRGD